MTDIREIAAALAAISPNDIGCAAVAIDGRDHPLWPSEEKAIASALPLRRREFAAGRAAARTALVRAGMTPDALPAGPDRCPSWPHGIVGSIAHDREFAIAAVGCGADWRGIGVDIERSGAVEAALAETILCAEEQPGCNDLTTIFCAKEAVQKAMFPITRELLSFHDVALRAETPGCYQARLQRQSGALQAGAAFRVRCARAGDHVLAAVFWPSIASRKSEPSFSASTLMS